MMNEQIKNLAEKCFYLPTHRTDFNDAINEFAELIVKECAEYLMDDGAVEAVAHRLKKHFGVE
jgi:DNA-binding transcriptional regulator PaaX